MASDTLEPGAVAAPENLDKLFEQARELSAFKFEEGDEAVIATTRAGSLVKVPRRAVGRAIAEGITPLEGAALAERGKRLAVQEEQAGILPALVAGTEEALSTATFGATDAALMGLASLAGTSREDYLKAREERQEGSPVASAVGTLTGLVVPALLTEGVSLVGAEASTAAKAARIATLPGVGGAMTVGKLATKGAGALLERALPASVMTAEELSAAVRAAQAAGTALPGARATLATVARTAAERVAGGAVEGALWGAGEGVRESILGKSDDVAEAVLSHAKADAVLFGELGGGLGVLEAGLPSVLRGARKVVNRAYDKLPAFGRDTLRATWKAEPGRTGVMAETAEELLAQRERLVAVDERFGTVLESLAASSPDAVKAAASHIDAVEAIAASRKGALDSVLGAPPEVRDEILTNFTSALGFEARAKGALEQLTATTPDRLQAAFANGAALDALIAGDRKALGRMLELKSDVLAKALENPDGIAALEAVTSNRAITAISRMSPDAAKWYVENAGRVAELEKTLPGYWQIFRAMTEGAESNFAVTMADDVLNNWRLSLTNVNERSRVLTEAIEQKSAEIAAGDALAVKLYEASIAAEREAFLKVGEIGGPPSIEGVQTALVDIAAEAERVSNLASDTVRFDKKLGKELADTANAIRRDFIGVTEEEVKKGIKAETDLYLSDPESAFYRIKEQRTKLDDRIRELKSGWLGLSTAEKDTVKLMDELRQTMTARYHDPTVFGEAASIRARSDDAFRRYKQATEDGGLFDKKFRESVLDKSGREARVIARTKVNTWLNQIGDAREAADVAAELGNNSSAWNAVSDAFINLVRTTEDILPKVTRAAVDINPEELRALAEKTLAATEDLQKRGYYSRLMFQMKSQAEGAGLNLIGLPPGLTTMGGFPHGVPTAWTSTGRPLVGDMAPEVSAIGGAAGSVASAAIPGGGIAAKGISSLLSIPTAQRQVVARVRGMVALERMGRRVADAVDNGARWLVGQATGKRVPLVGAFRELAPPAKVDEKKKTAAREEARRAVAARAPASRRATAEEAPPADRRTTAERREEEEVDRIIREANRLARDPAALSERIEAQSFAVAADLPETTAAVGRLAGRAAAVIARAAPVPEGQPLDEWRPSAADRAAVSRVREAVSRPFGLYQRALDGTLTREEVAAVSEVTPGILSQMRAAVQAQVEEARRKGLAISEQNRRGLETLLGYPLTTGGARTSVAKSQAVFGAARAGRSERPADGMARPLPGAAKLTLGERLKERD